MAQATDSFGETETGQRVDRVVLNGGGLKVSVLTSGATVQDLRLAGCKFPLVLGAPDVKPYFGPMMYFGGVVGRVANRISQSRYAYDGKQHNLDRNFLGRHMLHGGSIGTANRLWTLDGAMPNSVQLSLKLADGDMGFPGNLDVTVRYSLPGNGALQIDIAATTDAVTPCNFTHHGYFNLADSRSILGHHLQIVADAYLPVDQELIPTGEIRPVSGTPFDFTKERFIGDHGYDHNFCLSPGPKSLREVATLCSPARQISMRVETTEPGLQIYDGGQIPAHGLPGLGGRTYGKNAGMALETQGWPNAVNQPAFPNSMLRPGNRYGQTTRYVFHQTPPPG